ncbi:MAG: serine acetyltransferase [Treponema sp.]|jgi:serine O-acetyltransferase|nr:serine acetyltransferase [Treponema sp.]
MGNIRIKGLVEMLVKSYDEYADIIKVNTNNQLNRSVIIDVLEKLRCLLFPGYFGKKNLKSGSIEYYTGDLLEDVIFNLTRQIAFAIQRWEAFDICEDGIFDKAEELCFAFLEKLPVIREYLDTDVDAAFDGDPAAASKDEIISSYPGLYAILVSRLAHELHILSVPLIPRIMTEHAHSLTGIDIHPGASIGRYFFIDHGTGIVVGETTVIGDHVKLYQGVTLGALSTRGGQLLKNTKRHPTIESHVTIYSGASILGGETVIKEGVVVGSNAFITSSVPEKTKVSIKNPELQYKRDHEPQQSAWEENWYYTI